MFPRADLLKLYEQVVLTDIEFSDSQNVDQALWKNVFYQVIERFRQLLKEPAHDNVDNIRNILLTLLDEVGTCAPWKNLNEAWRRKRDQRALQVPGHHKVEAIVPSCLCYRVHCSLIRCSRSCRQHISSDWRITWTAWPSGLDPYAKR